MLTWAQSMLLLTSLWFLIHRPGTFQPRFYADQIVAGIDLLPTAAALAGAALNAGDGTFEGSDGESILPLLFGVGGNRNSNRKRTTRADNNADNNGGGGGGGGGGHDATAEGGVQSPTLHRTAIFWHAPVYLSGADCSIIFPVYSTSAVYWRNVPTGAVRSGKWKLIQFFETNSTVLFDLHADEGEANDVSASHPETSAKLLRLLQDWQKKVAAPIPQINHQFSRPGTKCKKHQHQHPTHSNAALGDIQRFAPSTEDAPLISHFAPPITFPFSTASINKTRNNGAAEVPSPCVTVLGYCWGRVQRWACGLPRLIRLLLTTTSNMVFFSSKNTMATHVNLI